MKKLCIAFGITLIFSLQSGKTSIENDLPKPNEVNICFGNFLVQLPAGASYSIDNAYKCVEFEKGDGNWYRLKLPATTKSNDYQKIYLSKLVSKAAKYYLAIGTKNKYSLTKHADTYTKKGS